MSFKYDIFDRYIAKTVDLDGAGAGAAVTERYVYDRDHIMLVFVGANLRERYLYGANLDQVLAVETTQVSWTLSDYLGTVRDLVSSAGVVQNHLKYDCFGNVTGQSVPLVKSRFGFTGRELDTETGLYYYRSRYYDPVVGRFISEDPIGFAAGDANLYRYVGNSPVNFVDPLGESPIIYGGQAALFTLGFIAGCKAALAGVPDFIAILAALAGVTFGAGAFTGGFISGYGYCAKRKPLSSNPTPINPNC